MKMEQRKFSRLRIRTLCEFSGPNGDQHLAQTRDVSRGGLLIEVLEDWVRPLPCLGEILTVTIQMPVNEVFPRRMMRCSGSVVRTFTATGLAPRIAIEFRDIVFAEDRPERRGAVRSRRCATSMGNEG